MVCAGVWSAVNKQTTAQAAMDKLAICFFILMAPLVGSRVEISGRKRAKRGLVALAAHGFRVM
jgi:hypothetical protein